MLLCLQELQRQGIPDMLSRWAPELLEGEQESLEEPRDPLDQYLDGTLPGADEPPEEGEPVLRYETVQQPAASWADSDEDLTEDAVFTPLVDKAATGAQENLARDSWAVEQNDPLADALDTVGLESDAGAGEDMDDDGGEVEILG